MFNGTDLAVGLFILIFFLTGWRKGFLRTLIGPVSTLISIVIVYFYFNRLNNPLLCLLILLFGPIALTIVFSVLLNVWNKTVCKNQPILWLSRLFGGGLSLLWGTVMIILVIVFIAVMPKKVFKLKKLQNNVIHSFSYTVIENTLLEKFPAVKGFEHLLDVYQNPQQAKRISSVPEFEDIYNDERIQELIKDEKLMKLIKKRDVVKIMADPKVMRLWQDEDFIKKILKLNQRVLNIESFPEEKPAPKVYELKM